MGGRGERENENLHAYEHVLYLRVNENVSHILALKSLSFLLCRVGASLPLFWVFLNILARSWGRKHQSMFANGYYELKTQK